MSRITLIILITLLATRAADAQVTIEVSQITCEQYLGFSVADPRDINIWLSGYYAGKRGSTVFEPQRVKEIGGEVRCGSKLDYSAQQNLTLVSFQTRTRFRIR